MSKNFLIAFGVGLAAIVIAVGGVLYMQRGAHIDLPGKILKVRTAALDENSSVAVFDFRISNPADYAFVVRDVTISLQDASGGNSQGMPVAEADTERLFQGVPLLGQKYNPTLRMRDKIMPHASEDRMLAARFEVPQARLDSRKRLVIRVEEMNGNVVEYADR